MDDKNKPSCAELREKILCVALAKKCDKIQERMHREFSSVLLKWEKVLFDYVSVSMKLSSLTKLTEEQRKINDARKVLRDSAEVIEHTASQFEEMWELMEHAMSVSTVNNGWLENAATYDRHLADIRMALEPMLIFSADRETIETVRKMVNQVSDIQTKTSALTVRVQEASTEQMRQSSAQMDAYLNKKLAEYEAKAEKDE